MVEPNVKNSDHDFAGSYERWDQNLSHCACDRLSDGVGFIPATIKSEVQIQQCRLLNLHSPALKACF